MAEETREIGVRMALGARRRQVIRLVLRQSLLLATAGVSTGIVAVWMLTRLLESRLFGVEALDPATCIAAVGAFGPIGPEVIPAMGPVMVGLPSLTRWQRRGLSSRAPSE